LTFIDFKKCLLGFFGLQNTIKSGMFPNSAHFTEKTKRSKTKPKSKQNKIMKTKQKRRKEKK